MTDLLTQGVIRWETPPETAPSRRDLRQRRRAWVLVAMDLRKKPGHWGLIDEDCGNSASVTSRINNGEAAWWQPAGAFLCVQRTINGAVNVYAVYLGENHEYAAIAGVRSLRAA